MEADGEDSRDRPFFRERKARLARVAGKALSRSLFCLNHSMLKLPYSAASASKRHVGVPRHYSLLHYCTPFGPCARAVGKAAGIAIGGGGIAV
jgi:hypothetical protein